MVSPSTFYPSTNVKQIPLETSLRFWIPVLGFLGVTPIMLLLGVISAGAGHGNYLQAKLFFPITMLSALPFQRITDPFIVLAIVQYPFYGVILGFANLRRRLAITAIELAIFHLTLAVAALVFVN